MKSLLLFVLASSACLAGGDSPVAQTSPIGRFCLFQAESLFVLPTGRTAELKMLWKLDTATGRAWHFYMGATTNATKERWVETFDSPTTFRNRQQTTGDDQQGPGANSKEEQ
jgi:hypothetical protein